ncbi:hypothetical protein PCASD_16156 [Puccinia coronata f. sp. avenae]|uniref:Uncharacterized protein n=1 Tax=Puccinia coronata f. sp. avenae TaxID=200324 RepID=A0A2N5TAQ0_9BASI|nr:hypothetical protein PCASD_16156 [Puccinia coronata f. sp. avenae]
MAAITPASQFTSSLANVVEPFLHRNNNNTHSAGSISNHVNPNRSALARFPPPQDTEDTFEDEDGLHDAMGSDAVGILNVDEDLVTCDAKLTDAQMERFADMDLTTLHAAAKSYAIRRRTTQEMREEVNDLYYEFQRKVVKVAIQNRVGDHLFFSHLGQNRRVRPNISWNNFQKYDPAAQKLYAEFGRNEGGSKVSALWESKNHAEKIRYCDVDYLMTLRETVTDAPPSAVPHPKAVAEDIINAKKAARLHGRTQVSNVTQKTTTTLVTDWIRKTEADLQSFAFFHQIEGFFVLASRHPKSPIFRKGGSPLGNSFLSMLAEDDKNDSAAEFHTWVAAQAIQLDKGLDVATKSSRIKPTGDIRDQFRVGVLAKNVSAIRKKLRELIRIASGGKINCAWPGENSQEVLKQMKITVRIDPNDWNVTLADIQRPLEELRGGEDLSVLACLGLNKIHMTYGDIADEAGDNVEAEADPNGANNDNNGAHNDDGEEESNRASDSDGSASVDRSRRKRARVASKSSRAKANRSTKSSTVEQRNRRNRSCRNRQDTVTRTLGGPSLATGDQHDRSGASDQNQPVPSNRNQPGPSDQSLGRNNHPNSDIASSDGSGEHSSPPSTSYGGLPSSFDPLLDPSLDDFL